jgi:hypothetical protein
MAVKRPASRSRASSALPQRRIENWRSLEALHQELDPPHVVDPRTRLHLVGVLGGGEDALPLGALGALVWQVESRALAPPIEEQIGMGCLDAAQVVEIVVLAEQGVAPLLGSSLQHGHRIAADRAIDPFAACLELVHGEIRSSHRSPLLVSHVPASGDVSRSSVSPHRRRQRAKWIGWL